MTTLSDEEEGASLPQAKSLPKGNGKKKSNVVHDAPSPLEPPAAVLLSSTRGAPTNKRVKVRPAAATQNLVDRQADPDRELDDAVRALEPQNLSNRALLDATTDSFTSSRGQAPFIV